MTTRHLSTLAALALAAAAVGGCSSDTSGGGDGNKATVSLTQISGSIALSGSGTISGTITRPSGFTGDVTIALSNLPPGVTATVVTQPVDGGSNFVIDVVVGPAVTAGQYNLSLTASGAGITTSTSSYALTVTSTTGGGAGTMTATIDGVPFTSIFAAASLVQGSFSVASADQAGTGLSVTLAGISGPGTYSLAFGGSTFGDGIVVSNGKGWGSAVAGGSGTVTFTTLTSTHAVGTFSFTAVPVSGGATGNRVVTNGAFDQTY